MTRLRALPFFLDAMRAQRLEGTRLRRLQEAKLRRIVRHAHATVPFYRRLWAAHGVDPASIRGLADLASLPVVTRAQLQESREEARISRAWPRSALLELRSSGSTARPMSCFRDPRFVALQRAVFGRALVAGGLRPWHRLMLVTGDEGKPRAGLPGWRFVPSEAPPEVVLAALESFRPHMLYGFLTPLRQLARLARARGGRPRLAAVFTTAETLDAATRALLQETFGAEVFDIYGCTETGALAWECRAHRGYHLAADMAVLEHLTGAASDVTSTVITHLELRGMPLIRYVIGDVAVPATGGPCPCGCRLPRLARIEGRLIDCVRLPDGRLLSPYRLTMALQGVPGLARYQAIQHDERRFLVRAEGPERSRQQAAAAIAGALRRELGPHARPDIRWEDDIEPPPGRKFRAVECRIGAEPPAQAAAVA